MQVRDLLIEPLKEGNVLVSDIISEDYIEIEQEHWEELKQAIEESFNYYKE